MKSALAKLFVVMTVLFVGIFAFAQMSAPPETVDQAVGWLPQLLASFASGNSVVGYAIIVMLVVLGVRQYVLPKADIPATWLPTVSALIAVIMGVAFNYASGKVGIDVPMIDTLKAALVAALFSGVTWDWIGQNIAKAILGDKYAEPVPKQE